MTTTTASTWSALPLPPNTSEGGLWVVTSAFGARKGKHKGIDLATHDAGEPVVGLPVFAVAPGVVARLPDDDSGGMMLVLELVDGAEVKYAHLSDRSVVVGDLVGAGDRIAFSGNTGDVTGPHLHLSWWPKGRAGEAEDPLPLLQQAAEASAGGGGGWGALIVVGGVGLLGLTWWLGRDRK